MTDIYSVFSLFFGILGVITWTADALPDIYSIFSVLLITLWIATWTADGLPVSRCDVSYYWDEMLRHCLPCSDLCGTEFGLECRKRCPGSIPIVVTTGHENHSTGPMIALITVSCLLTLFLAAVALLWYYGVIQCAYRCKNNIKPTTAEQGNVRSELLPSAVNSRPGL